MCVEVKLYCNEWNSHWLIRSALIYSQCDWSSLHINPTNITCAFISRWNHFIHERLIWEQLIFALRQSLLLIDLLSQSWRLVSRSFWTNSITFTLYMEKRMTLRSVDAFMTRNSSSVWWNDQLLSFPHYSQNRNAIIELGSFFFFTSSTYYNFVIYSLLIRKVQSDHFLSKSLGAIDHGYFQLAAD